jgi:hypothetical protein
MRTGSVLRVPGARGIAWEMGWMAADFWDWIGRICGELSFFLMSGDVFLYE